MFVVTTFHLDRYNLEESLVTVAGSYDNRPQAVEAAKYELVTILSSVEEVHPDKDFKILPLNKLNQIKLYDTTKEIYVVIEIHDTSTNGTISFIDDEDKGKEEETEETKTNVIPFDPNEYDDN